MVKNVRTAQSKRKDIYDQDAVVRTFKKEEMVLTKPPGLQNKLEGGYEGSYEILEVPMMCMSSLESLEKLVVIKESMFTLTLASLQSSASVQSGSLGKVR